jgi:hypothetical protein
MKLAQGYAAISLFFCLLQNNFSKTPEKSLVKSKTPQLQQNKADKNEI